MDNIPSSSLERTRLERTNLERKKPTRPWQLEGQDQRVGERAPLLDRREDSTQLLTTAQGYFESFLSFMSRCCSRRTYDGSPHSDAPSTPPPGPLDSRPDLEASDARRERADSALDERIDASSITTAPIGIEPSTRSSSRRQSFGNTPRYDSGERSNNVQQSSSSPEQGAFQQQPDPVSERETAFPQTTAEAPAGGPTREIGTSNRDACSNLGEGKAKQVEASDSDDSSYRGEYDPYAAMEKQREINDFLGKVKLVEKEYEELLRDVQNIPDNIDTLKSDLSENAERLQINRDDVSNIVTFNEEYGIKAKNIVCQIVETENMQLDPEKDNTPQQQKIDECGEQKKRLKYILNVIMQRKDYEIRLGFLMEENQKIKKLEGTISAIIEKIRKTYKDTHSISEKLKDPDFQKELSGKSAKDYEQILKNLEGNYQKMNSLQKGVPSARTLLAERLQIMRRDLGDVSMELGKLSLSRTETSFAKTFRLPSKLSSFAHELIPTLRNFYTGESDLPTVVGSILSSLHSCRPLLDLPEEWQKKFAIAKGREIKKRDKPPLDQDIVNRILANRYKFTLGPVDTNADKEVIALMGDDRNNYVCIEAKVEETNRACYRNYINVRKGIIISAFNYRNKDDDEVRSDSRSIPNSEILAHMWKTAVTKEKDKPVEDIVLGEDKFNLTRIIGANIDNREALATIDLFVQKDSQVTFGKGSEEYDALLGMCICEGKLFLLEQHFSGLEISALTVKRETTGEQVDLIGNMLYGIKGEIVNITYEIGRQ